MSLNQSLEVIDFLKKHAEPKRSPDELGRLGKYRLRNVLGMGGMGIVFQAQDMLLRRDVALKVLLPEKIGDDQARKQFLLEARAAANIKHDNVMPLLDANIIKDVIYLVMPFVAGSTVMQRVKKSGPLSAIELLQMAHESALGLAAAHEKNILHRDISPNNLWLEMRGDKFHTMLLDFGLAKLLNVNLQSTRTYQPNSQTGRSTQTNSSAAATTIRGTPGYIAPEQFDGKTSEQSDLFSLGATLFHGATGSPPFSGSDMNQMMMNNCRQEPSNVSKLRNDLPKSLQDLIMKLMSRKCEDRPVSAAQVVRDCEQMRKSLSFNQALPTTSLNIEKKNIEPIQPTKQMARLSRLHFGLMVGGVLVVLLLLALFLFLPQNPDLSKSQAPTVSSSEAVPSSVIEEGDLLIDVSVKKKNASLGWIPLNDKHRLIDQALPVVAGEEFFVQFHSKKPVYAYMIWLSGEGVVPLYPWIDKNWQLPPKEEKLTRLRIPEAGNSALTFQGSLDSMETVLAWVFAEPQPQLSEKLRERFAQLTDKSSSLQNLQSLIWYQDGVMLPVNPRYLNRSNNPSDDPILQMSSIVEKFRQELGGTTLSVTIAKQGSVAANAPSVSSQPLIKTPAATSPASRAPSIDILRNNPHNRPLGPLTQDRLFKLAQCLQRVNQLTLEADQLIINKKMDEAKAKGEEAIALLKRELGDSDPLADIPSNILSKFYLEKNDHVTAEKHALLFLSVMKQLSESKLPQFKNQYFTALVNLVTVYVASNRYAEADLIMTETLAIFNRNGNPDSLVYAQTLVQLAGALFPAGKFDEAEKYARLSYDMYQRLYMTPEHRKANAGELANVANSLAVILDARGKLAEAKRYHEESLAISTGSSLPADARALALQNNAFDKMYRGEKAEALPLYQQAYDLYCATYPVVQFTQGHSNIAQCAALFGDACAACGQFDKAKTLLNTSVDMYKKLFPPTIYPIGQRETAHSLYNLGMFYFVQRDFANAKPALVESMELTVNLLNSSLERLSEADSRFFVEAMPYNLYTLLTLNKDYDPQLHALQFKSKSIVTREMEARRIKLAFANDAEANRLSEQLERIRQNIVNITTSPGSSGSTGVSAGDLQANKELLEKQLARQLASRNIVHTTTPILPTDLTRLLPANSAFIDFAVYGRMTGEREGLFHVGNYHYLAYVMLPGVSPVRVELGPAEKIDEALKAWLTEIPRLGDLSSERQKATQLAARLFDPLRAHLGANVKHLYLSPDSRLHQMPWHALPGSTPNKMLVDDCSVSVVPHGSYLVERLKQPDSAVAGDRFLVMGGLEYGSPTPPRPPFAYLPGTEQECTFIIKLLKRVRTQTALNRVQAKTYADDLLADLSQAHFAHLATHGYFDAPAVDANLGDLQRRNPMTLSGIALSDANQPVTSGSQAHVLTAEQIVGKDLSNLDLIVLSACDTGLGEMTLGEGNLGLQRAFHIAGCRHTVTALWKVPDRDTATLMSLFYRNLLVKKMPARDALRFAQLELLHRPDVIEELSAANVDATLDKWVRDADQPVNIPIGGQLSKTGTWAGFVLSGK